MPSSAGSSSRRIDMVSLRQPLRNYGNRVCQEVVEAEGEKCLEGGGLKGRGKKRRLALQKPQRAPCSDSWAGRCWESHKGALWASGDRDELSPGAPSRTLIRAGHRRRN